MQIEIKKSNSFQSPEYLSTRKIVHIVALEEQELYKVTFCLRTKVSLEAYMYILTNSVVYGTRKFNAAFIRALQ